MHRCSTYSISIDISLYSCVFQLNPVLYPEVIQLHADIKVLYVNHVEGGLAL